MKKEPTEKKLTKENHKSNYPTKVGSPLARWELNEQGFIRQGRADVLEVGMQGFGWSLTEAKIYNHYQYRTQGSIRSTLNTDNNYNFQVKIGRFKGCFRFVETGETTALKVGCSRRTVTSFNKKLIKAKLLHLETRGGKGKGNSYVLIPIWSRIPKKLKRLHHPGLDIVSERKKAVKALIRVSVGSEYSQHYFVKIGAKKMLESKTYLDAFDRVINYLVKLKGKHKNFMSMLYRHYFEATFDNIASKDRRVYISSLVPGQKNKEVFRDFRNRFADELEMDSYWVDDVFEMHGRISEDI